jgi:endonuclease/exonuclease/phosphatase family metal-dependent hydrolase
MYPTFFIRSENFELIGSEDRWLSETPDIAGSTSFGSAFPRLMTWLRVQPVGLRHRLLLVNTHLDHVRPETRTAQIRVLCEELRKIRSTDTHLTVMGDFNDSPESEVRRTLERELNLVDSWLLHNEVEESSHHPFTGKLDTGSRIDWIMVNEGMRVERCFLDKASRGDRWPSDHFPVVCELRL